MKLKKQLSLAMVILYSMVFCSGAALAAAPYEESPPSEDVLGYAVFGEDPQFYHMDAYVGEKRKITVMSQDGKEGWTLDPSSGTDARYIYVNLDDKVLYGNDDGSNFYVTVEYYDEGISSLGMEYAVYEQPNLNYTMIPYGESETKVRTKECDWHVFGDTRTWKKHTWLIQAASMDSSLDGADLRFGVYSPTMGVSRGGKVLVHSVEVRRADHTKSQINIENDIKTMGNIFFEGDTVDLDFTFNNKKNPYYSKKAGTYDADVIYEAVDSGGNTVWSNTETITLQPMVDTKTNIKFKVEKFDTYKIYVTAKCDRLGIYSTEYFEFSYVLTTRGAVHNEKAGINAGYYDFDIADDGARLKSWAGFKNVRMALPSPQWIDSSFEKVYPNNSAPYAYYIDFYAATQKYGLNIMAYPQQSSTYTTHFEEDKSPIAYTPGGKQRFSDWVLQVVDFFGGSCKEYAILNEPNLQSNNTKNLPASVYTELVDTVSKKVKAQHPDVKILAAETSMVPKEWFESFLGRGLYDAYDAILIHPYWADKNPIDFPVSDGQVKDLAELMKKYGVDKEIWATEYGYSSNYEKCTSEEQQAHWNVVVYLELMEDNLCDRAYLYSMASRGVRRTEREDNFGLLKAKTVAPTRYAAKKGYLGFSNLNIRLADAEFVKKITPGSNAAGHLYKKATGEDVLVLYSGKPSEKIILDLGVDAVDVYDFCGNKTRIQSSDGRFTFTAGEAAMYVEGSFQKCDVVDQAAVSIDRDTVNASYRDKVTVLIHNNSGEKLSAAVTLREDSQLKVVSCDDEKIVMETGDTAPENLEPVGIRLSGEKGIYFDGTVRLNYVEKTVLSAELKMNDQNNWCLYTTVQNNSTEAALDGTLRIVSPAAWSGVFDRSSIKLAPGDSETVAFTVPDRLASDDTTVSVEFKDRGGTATTLNQAISFAYAKKTAIAPKIDADLDEWPQAGKMYLNRQENYEAAIIETGQYSGNDDLSGELQIMWDKDNLYFAAKVKDDVFFCQGLEPRYMYRGDSIQLAMVYDPNDQYLTSSFEEFGFALLDKKPTYYRWKTRLSQGTDIKGCEVAIVNRDGYTYYEAKVPWSSLVARPEEIKEKTELKFAAVLNDNDGLGRKGYMKYADGIANDKNSSLFTRLYLLDR